ncbi:hypothetical protein [Pseudomonas serbica]|jgi:hypothetical protein
MEENELLTYLSDLKCIALAAEKVRFYLLSNLRSTDQISTNVARLNISALSTHTAIDRQLFYKGRGPEELINLVTWANTYYVPFILSKKIGTTKVKIKKTNKYELDAKRLAAENLLLKAEIKKLEHIRSLILSNKPLIIEPC